MKTLVTIYEVGGKVIDELIFFDSRYLAVNFCKKYNRTKNWMDINVSDWYMFAVVTGH